MNYYILVFIALFLTYTSYSQRTQKSEQPTLHISVDVPKNEPKSKSPPPRTGNHIDFEPNSRLGSNDKGTAKSFTGTGSINYSNASYSGEIKKGKIHGKGILYYKDHTFLNGVWNNGSFVTGTGKLEYYDGKYSGSLKTDREGFLTREGTGKLEYKNGDVVEGSFKNNVFIEGSGTLNKNYSTYNGQVKVFNNKILPHGKGVTRYKSGSKFSGIYKNGKKQQGTYTFNNGIIKKGTWNGEKFNGDVLLTLSKLSQGSINALEEFSEMTTLANTLYMVTAFAPLVMHFTSGTNWKVPGTGTVSKRISQRNKIAFTEKTLSTIPIKDSDWVALARVAKGLNITVRAKIIQFCEVEMIKHKNERLDYLFWKNLRDSFM